MKKAILAIAAAAVLAVGTLSAPTTAEARCHGCGVGAGIVGGLAAGAIIGGAIASWRPAYRYGPAPGYECTTVIALRYPTDCPGGYWARRPVRDGYGNVVGWSRPRFICPDGRPPKPRSEFHPATRKRRRVFSATALALATELLVLDPVRDDRIHAEPAHLVLLVVLEVALEPFDMAVALEGQNVRGDAVEEPAIMADDDGAAGEILQRLFERAQAYRRRDRWSARRAAAGWRRT